jgi:hypothetical protein
MSALHNPEIAGAESHPCNYVLLEVEKSGSPCLCGLHAASGPTSSVSLLPEMLLDPEIPPLSGPERIEPPTSPMREMRLAHYRRNQLETSGLHVFPGERAFWTRRDWPSNATQDRRLAAPFVRIPFGPPRQKKGDGIYAIELRPPTCKESPGCFGHLHHHGNTCVDLCFVTRSVCRPSACMKGVRRPHRGPRGDSC